MGMYFPDIKGCSTCPYNKVWDNGEYICDRYTDVPPHSLSERPKQCRAVKIDTPHGNLIDANDAVKKYGTKMDWSILKWVNEVDLTCAKTIIKQEE